MSCPICFSASDSARHDVPIDEVKVKLQNVINDVGIVPIQISGGEPTLHPDLPEIIDFASKSGFKNIELVTNGLEISENPNYLPALAEKGLTAVYLQFDGLQKETYIGIRGRDMGKIRQSCVEAIRKAKLCCTLAVAVTRGINDHELGDIVRFGVSNIDIVRAINFQSATRFSGRFDTTVAGKGYTLSEIISGIESQADLKPGGFLKGLVGHEQCNGVSLLYLTRGRLEPLFSYLRSESIENFLLPDKRKTILDLFQGKEKFCRSYLLNPKTWKLLGEARTIFGNKPELQSILRPKHILIFAKSFMEKSNFCNKRLEQCCYGIATSRGVYSFCAYNNFHRFSSLTQGSGHAY